MALVLGTNAFTDVTTFDAYCGDRLDMSAAFEATSAAKSAALVSATDILNELPWTGVVVDRMQPLAFPRSGTYFDPKVGGRMPLMGIPPRIVQATIELAAHLLENEGVQDSTGGVINMVVGEINMTRIQRAPVIPQKVNNIIRPILVNNGSSGWWRAN